MTLVLVERENRRCENILTADGMTRTVAVFLLLNTLAMDTYSALGSPLGSSNAADLRKQ